VSLQTQEKYLLYDRCLLLELERITCKNQSRNHNSVYQDWAYCLYFNSSLSSFVLCSS